MNIEQSKAKRKVGGQKKPEHLKRVRLECLVTPETRRLLAEICKSRKISEGKAVDYGLARRVTREKLDREHRLEQPVDHANLHARIIEDQLQEINSQREYLVRAFIAQTGAKPSECEIVETRGPNPTWSIRKRIQPDQS